MVAERGPEIQYLVNVGLFTLYIVGLMALAPRVVAWRWMPYTSLNVEKMRG